MTRSNTDNTTEMIRIIDAHVRDTRRDTGRNRLSPAVMQAMRAVPRERFVPLESRHLAYGDGPLPIGGGQTISQPFIVALMTDLLDPMPEHRVLDVGTGSGYQAAVLAEIVGRVYGIELVDALSRHAMSTLIELGYDNVEIRNGDGRLGWPEHAPFDGITVAAASRDVPPELLKQLKIGAHLVIPLENALGWQTLTRITRTGEGSFDRRDVLGVRFVPLMGG